jgi:5'(3')-deoxyribonucleotidase
MTGDNSIKGNNTKTTVMNRKRVYFDMDGVIVDFESGVAKLDEETRKEYEGRIDETPGLFALMEPIPGAIEAIQLLAKHFDVYILSTSPWNNPTAASDKIEWVKKYLNGVFHKRVIITHHKELLIGDYLIDDRSKNGAGEFTGEWIQFGSEQYPDWDAVLKYLLM